MENKSGEFGMFFFVLECLFDTIIFCILFILFQYKGSYFLAYFTLELFNGIGS